MLAAIKLVKSVEHGSESDKRALIFACEYLLFYIFPWKASLDNHVTDPSYFPISSSIFLGSQYVLRIGQLQFQQEVFFAVIFPIYMHRQITQRVHSSQPMCLYTITHSLDCIP